MSETIAFANYDRRGRAETEQAMQPGIAPNNLPWGIPLAPPPPPRRVRFWQRRWVRVVVALLATVVVFVCGLLAGVTAQRAQDNQLANAGVLFAPRYATTTTSNIAYGSLTSQGERLDLCQPQGASGNRPGVLFIHGGGWVGGDKTDFAALCTYFAGLGFIGANIDYRLGPASPWPAQIVDAQLAVRWLRANAAKLHLDVAHLCSFGASAGGHLAMMLGILTTIHPGDEASVFSTEPTQVSCVVSWSGPTDLATLPQSNPTVQAGLQGLFGTKPDPASVRDASPLLQVTTTTAPMLLALGKQDPIVPPDQAERMQQALSNAGIPVTLIETNGDHSLGDGPVVVSVIEQSTTFILLHSR